MRTGVLLCLGWGLVACGPSASTGGVSTEKLEALQARIEALESANQALSLKLSEHENLLGQGETWSGVVGSRLDTLEAKTASLSQQEINGQPALVISGVNLHLHNGEGSTDAVNARGNLIIGYQAETAPESIAGSHNLVVGEGHSYPETAHGGVVFGRNNHLGGPFAAVTGGAYNSAIGPTSSVSGGHHNRAEAEASSVSGGLQNVASGPGSSVSGGTQNSVTGEVASVSGGVAGLASGYAASISGGAHNVASGKHSSILAGHYNVASGQSSAVSGGTDNNAMSMYASISGGQTNFVDNNAFASSISGGRTIVLSGIAEWAGGTFADP